MISLVNFKKLTDFFHKNIFFCFTCDVEWSPEWAIKSILDLFEEFDIPLTLFITHSSDLINEKYKDKEKYAGLHPNFFPGSTQGSDSSEIISSLIALWPDAVSFRSHAFFDNTLITKEFYKRGFKYDSNICLFLQPFSVPLFHQSGLIRFPVCWEDDIHWLKELPFNLLDSGVKKFMDFPGLKVFNFHPLNIVLNTPSQGFYEEHKFLYNRKIMEEKELSNYIYRGRGTRDFAIELLTYLKEKNIASYYMYDIFQAVCDLTY